VMKCSYPPIAIEVCCKCGEEQGLTIRIPEQDPEGHGPFHPKARK
jgi:hypothetical protein